MRPPVLPSGNVNAGAQPAVVPGFNEAAGFTQRKPVKVNGPIKGKSQRFNEAAGFTQRKLLPAGRAPHSELHASMRPPVLPSGNYSMKLVHQSSCVTLQ